MDSLVVVVGMGRVHEADMPPIPERKDGVDMRLTSCGAMVLFCLPHVLLGASFCLYWWMKYHYGHWNAVWA